MKLIFENKTKIITLETALSLRPFRGKNLLKMHLWNLDQWFDWLKLQTSRDQILGSLISLVSWSFPTMLVCVPVLSSGFTRFSFIKIKYKLELMGGFYKPLSQRSSFSLRWGNFVFRVKLLLHQKSLYLWSTRRRQISRRPVSSQKIIWRKKQKTRPPVTQWASVTSSRMPGQ